MQSRLAAIALAIIVTLLSSCHTDPKIDPNKDGGDKGGSYSESMEVPSPVLVD